MGGVFRQEEQLGTSGPDQLANGMPFVAAEIVHDHEVAGGEGRHEKLLDIDAEAGAVNRPVDNAGRGAMRSHRKATRKVSVRHRPCGTFATRRAPRRQRPCRRVMLVLAEVSSMKTRRLGSSRP